MISDPQCLTAISLSRIDGTNICPGLNERCNAKGDTFYNEALVFVNVQLMGKVGRPLEAFAHAHATNEGPTGKELEVHLLCLSIQFRRSF